jgi:hypothetical protein
MSLPSYLEPDGNKKRSDRQEKRVQKQLASGALWYNKGDLIDAEAMYECKIGKKQVTVTYEMLNKLFEEAHKSGKEPILIIEIENRKFIGRVV